MYTTNSQEVSDAVKLLNLNVEMLSVESSHNILNNVLKKFTANISYSYPLWENINVKESVQYKFGWELLKQIFKGKEVILFFDWSDDKNMFLFPDGSMLTEVMANCFSFIFYLTNIENDFLLAFNDHDYIIGAGDEGIQLIRGVRSWLDSTSSGSIN